jgi:hypothetical protein
LAVFKKNFFAANKKNITASVKLVKRGLFPGSTVADIETQNPVSKGSKPALSRRKKLTKN